MSGSRNYTAAERTLQKQLGVIRGGGPADGPPGAAGNQVENPLTNPTTLTPSIQKSLTLIDAQHCLKP